MQLGKFVISLLAILFIWNNVYPQEIVYVYDPARIDDVTGINPDIPVMTLFEEQGYTVTRYAIRALDAASQEELDSLNNADMVFIGRAVGSDNFQDPNEDDWNAITAPIMTQNMWALRSNRMKWFDTEDCTNVDDDISSSFFGNIDADDVVFEGLSGVVEWWVGPYSTIEVTEVPNGEVLATKTDGGQVLFVRFSADIPYYDGGPTPAGDRVYFGSASDNKLDENENRIYNYLGFTDDIKNVFLNEVGRILGVFPAGVTENNKLTNGLTVYPIPANNNLVVEMESMKSVNILDLSGRNISSYKVYGKETTLDITELNSGIYILKIRDKLGNVRTMKFIKE